MAQRTLGKESRALLEPSRQVIFRAFQRHQPVLEKQIYSTSRIYQVTHLSSCDVGFPPPMSMGPLLAPA